jgi:hypothetical protein
VTTADPWSGESSTGVTIKYGSGYEDAWMTFKGSPEGIRSQLIAAFGMESASVSTLSLAELVSVASRHAQAINAGSSVGRIVSGSPSSEAETEQETEQKIDAENDPWAVKPEAPKDPLFQAIEAEGSVEGLKRLYAENKAKFEADTTLTEAWRTRGRALSAAGHPASD